MNSSDSDEVLTPLLPIPAPQVISSDTELVYLGCIQSLFTNAIGLLLECKGAFVYGTFDSQFDQVTEQITIVKKQIDEHAVNRKEGKVPQTSKQFFEYMKVLASNFEKQIKDQLTKQFAQIQKKDKFTEIWKKYTDRAQDIVSPLLAFQP